MPPQIGGQASTVALVFCHSHEERLDLLYCYIPRVVCLYNHQVGSQFLQVTFDFFNKAITISLTLLTRKLCSDKLKKNRLDLMTVIEK